MPPFGKISPASTYFIHLNTFKDRPFKIVLPQAENRMSTAVEWKDVKRMIKKQALSSDAAGTRCSGDQTGAMGVMG